MKGKFIVIDGLDGSGKGTQTELLVRRLQQEGHDIMMMDFPRYGQKSAYFVECYLRGEYGSAEEVGAKRASLFFALDRYAASLEMKAYLEKGGIIVSNRYVSASKGHQLGKLHDQQEMKRFLDWLNELEYHSLGIPVPDLTLFLHMKPEIGQRLVDLKSEREYTQGKKRDIHEADLGHLQNAERAFLFCLEHDTVENWQKIVCFAKDENDEEMPRSREEVHAEIYEKVKEILGY